MDFIKIDLDYPIATKDNSGNEREFKYLKIGRVKAKHLKFLPKNLDPDNPKVNPEEMIPLIAGLTGLSKEEADEIDMVDILKIAEELPKILGELESRKTGNS